MVTEAIENKPNSIEAARLEIGLTIPQMLKAVGARDGQAGLLSADDLMLNPAFVRKAKAMQEAYRRWIFDLRERVAACHCATMTAVEVARLLGISEFNVAKLAERGQLESINDGRRRLYVPAAIMAFIDGNSRHLTEHGRTRAPLATAFLEQFVLTDS